MTEKPVTNDPFDIPSVTRPEGYLHVDHRNSPGLPEDIARRMGYDPLLTREGRVFEAATLGCAHCPSAFMKKQGEEGFFCAKCGYAPICDACAAASVMPGYVHRTRNEFVDLVRSGKWELSGSMSLPTFTRKETDDV